MNNCNGSSGHQETEAERIDADCCICGAGPAGLMLGYLLARAGLHVIVIEKHQDFLRDFRGDTIHPSTLEAINRLGLLEALLQRPHQKAHRLHAEINGRDVVIADFSRLPVSARYIAFMPQWDFLDFLNQEAGKFSGFTLMMGTAAKSLLRDNGQICGITADNNGKPIEIHAPLTIAADGRNSILRQEAGLVAQEFSTPTDIIWFKLTKQSGDPVQKMGHVGPKQGFVMIDRGDYWQCGYVIAKSSFDELKSAGLENLRDCLTQNSPFERSRFEDISSFNDVHLLRVKIDRLQQWWQPGFLCIGDAAHAMSPIGGVGVNLAIQDAIATANLLNRPLKEHRLSARDLARVQKRRHFPTWATQKLQLMMRGKRRPQNQDAVTKKPSAIMQKIATHPWLAHVAGRMMGMGFRPEWPDL